MTEKAYTVTISWLSSILGILLIDLILSGDNAIVIGAVASRLPPEQRMIAIAVGGGAAVVLRVLFALTATFLLQVRFIGIIGSVLLLFIAIQLLIDRSRNKKKSGVEPLSNTEESRTGLQQRGGDRPEQKKYVHQNVLLSINTILLADVTMSLDNALAIGGIAAGDVLSLTTGLLFSVIFLLVGSALVAECIARLPWLLDVASLVVAWTAAQVFLDDDVLHPFLMQFPWVSLVVYVVALIVVLIVDIVLYVRDHPMHTHH